MSHRSKTLFWLVLLTAALVVTCSSFNAGVSVISTSATDGSFRITTLMVKRGAVGWITSYRTGSMFSSSDDVATTEWHRHVELTLPPLMSLSTLTPIVHHGTHIPSPGAAASYFAISIPIWLMALPFQILGYRIAMRRANAAGGFPVIEASSNRAHIEH